MIDLEDRILMAVPKKGRLNEITIKYLSKIGLSFYKRDRFDIALCSQTPLALIFLPAKDIPLYVSDGKVCLGITGKDMVEETRANVEEVLDLGYGKCRLCLATPKKDKLKPQDLLGKRIATSFPYLTQKYFQEKWQGSVKIQEISGSVEIAPTLGSAEGITDLVETGSTLIEAGLEVIDTILETSAFLIARKNLSSFETEWKERIKKRFEGILTAEKYVLVDYNIEKKLLKQAEKITPGMKSPTIMALEQEGWVAVRSVIKKSEMHYIVEQLKTVGAEAILVSTMDYFQI